jgi:hypothetical protein
VLNIDFRQPGFITLRPAHGTLAFIR